jgi:hypothetical protein
MALYAFGFTYLVFSLVNSSKSMRVSKEVELEGLDIPEFGMDAYPEDRVEMLAPGAQRQEHKFARAWTLKDLVKSSPRSLGLMAGSK